MKNMLEEIDLKVPFEVIDVDVSPDIAMDFGIRSVPTLVMMDEMIEMKRLTGIKTKEQLTEWLNA